MPPSRSAPWASDMHPSMLCAMASILLMLGISSEIMLELPESIEVVVINKPARKRIHKCGMGCLSESKVLRQCATYQKRQAGAWLKNIFVSAQYLAL